MRRVRSLAMAIPSGCRWSRRVSAATATMRPCGVISATARCARGQQQPVPRDRIPLDARRVKRRNAGAARQRVGAHAHAVAIDERSPRNRPREDGHHSSQRAHARLLAREQQRAGAGIVRQPLDLALRADAGVVRAERHVHPVRAFAALVQEAVARHEPEATASDGESLEITGCALTPHRERFRDTLAAHVQLEDDGTLVRMREHAPIRGRRETGDFPQRIGQLPAGVAAFRDGVAVQRRRRRDAAREHCRDQPQP